MTAKNKNPITISCPSFNFDCKHGAFQVSFLGQNVFLIDLISGQPVQDMRVVEVVAKYLKAEGFII